MSREKWIDKLASALCAAGWACICNVAFKWISGNYMSLEGLLILYFVMVYGMEKKETHHV